MNKEQFIFWLKGFTKAVNEEGPTLKQWETIVSELDKIKDCPNFGSPISDYNTFSNWTSTSYKANLPKEDNQLELDLK